ncbi:MAG: C4-dicarboxylate ABC transporter permease [Cyclobacteriaceae bacterium]|nr:MAG: C4-dicarboxylate ABC transporter permease [Cyclobacteriaceae bacterium]
MAPRDQVDKYLEWVLIVLMGLLVIDVLWQVGSRYLLASPSWFADELAGFLLMWVGLLGAAYVTGKSEHLAIDLLLQRAEQKQKQRLKILINLLIAMFALVVMVAGGSWLVYTRFYLQVTSAALQVPLGYIYLVLPLSGILMLYYSTDNILRFLKNKP